MSTHTDHLPFWPNPTLPQLHHCLALGPLASDLPLWPDVLSCELGRGQGYKSNAPRPGIAGIMLTHYQLLLQWLPKMGGTRDVFPFPHGLPNTGHCYIRFPLGVSPGAGHSHGQR